MIRLAIDLARPHRGWLAIILFAMLVETLAGLAGPWPLKIVIDHAVGHNAAPAWVRSYMGFVLQDTVLFRGTVRENIAYGRHHATEAQIVAAAKLANADEFIVRMPAGYDTPIAERGVTLSGGQRRPRPHHRHRRPLN